MEGERVDRPQKINLDVALVHYPVCNKNKEVIGSAVTNLDIHDIARLGRTYGVDNYYIVTPYEDQQQLVREILDHWLTGHGGEYNAKRKEALSIVRLCDDMDALIAMTTEKWQQKPVVLATSASRSERVLTYAAASRMALAGEKMLLLFGTAWGLVPEVLDRVDGILPPIIGTGDYNHLSVRAAAAIILDRLLGKR